jgi:hypothetical protein
VQGIFGVAVAGLGAADQLTLFRRAENGSAPAIAAQILAD